MPLRPFLLPTVCALAALTAACDGDNSVRISSTTTNDSDAKGVLKVVETLQCPQTMGSLTRKGSASNEGTVCTYVGPKGAEVTLQLVPLGDRTPPQVLKTFEERLSSDMPQAVAGLRAGAARAQADAARSEADAARAEAEVARAQARADAAVDVAVQANGDDADIRLPGMHIETKGDQASVRIGGIHIDANDNSGAVDIEGGDNGDSVSIRAQDDSAEVRAMAAGDATRASWILTDNRPSAGGWRLVGYEARGPFCGPLLVATIRSPDRNRCRVFEDAKDLVALNAGE